MKVVFLSNYFNHHQKPLCDELYYMLGEDFTFISTAMMREERKKLGYGSDNERQYVLLAYDNNENAEKAQKLIDSADVVITGSAPEKLLKNRKQNKKIILRYSERPLKKGFGILKYPVRWYKWHRDNPGKAPIYMLCASAYTSSDYAKFGMFINRSFKWGYFPECREYENPDNLFSQKAPFEILWCGRFLDWKHPDDVLKAAKRLKEEGYKFHISIIGAGEMKDELKNLYKNSCLEDCVDFLNPMPPEEVRNYMEKTGIYLFTSDRKEGWGAVLNEAMNSGCAIIASHAAGSVPYLIKNNENGFIYESGDIDMLVERIKYLLENPEEQKRLGFAAYKTIKEEWNAAIAAERLVKLIETIIEGKSTENLFENGPCSPA